MLKFMLDGMIKLEIHIKSIPILQKHLIHLQKIQMIPFSMQIQLT